MPIVVGSKGLTIGGQNIPAYTYVDWLTSAQEAAAVQGGDAAFTPARGLNPNESAAARALVSGAGVSGLLGKRAAAVVGQSVERGSGRLWAGPGSAATAMTFEGLGLSDPITPAVTALGSAWPYLNSHLRNRGHTVTWRNCAIGGSSFIKQWCGQVTNWAANTAYHGQRASIGTGDSGDYGDVIVNGTRVFRCTAGRARYASNSSGVAIPGGGGATNVDYIVVVGTQTSGATVPAAFATAAVNDVIVDGGVTWTCISTTLGTLSAFKVLASGESGFDPLGLMARTKAQLDAVTGMDEKWVFMANGQSDVGGSLGSQGTIRGWYKQAVENMVAYFRAQGYRVAVGFTCWNPGSTTFADATYPDQFRTLQLAINDAFTTTWSALTDVVRGGDLYAAFGYNVQTYPEPPATAISGTNAPHLVAAEHPRFAEVWRDALIASGRW